MTTITDEHFDRQYQSHLKHLKLKGLQPKTIDAYARAIRRLGGYFSHRIDDLSEAQLTGTGHGVKDRAWGQQGMGSAAGHGVSSKAGHGEAGHGVSSNIPASVAWMQRSGIRDSASAFCFPGFHFIPSRLR